MTHRIELLHEPWAEAAVVGNYEIVPMTNAADLYSEGVVPKDLERSVCKWFGLYVPNVEELRPSGQGLAAPSLGSNCHQDIGCEEIK